MGETGPTIDKTKKYDRQLRLWGDHGQASLENANVCLINATATGTEILKNLILPGVGSFTIIDNKRVSGEDVGNNFFLTKDYIGHNRAKAATELLLEMNEEVYGYTIEEGVEDILANNENQFKNFTLVIATDVCEHTLLQLASLLQELDIPLVICKSYGFIGYLRICTSEHTIIESHPDSEFDDLRLDRPLPEFVTFCEGQNLGTMSKKEHSHTPWLVLVHKCLTRWRHENDGCGPKNYKEKTKFKDLLREEILRNEDGVPADEENFDEAITHVNTALLPSRIPDHVTSILNDPQCLNVDNKSKSFWLLARAVKEFVINEGQGLLPLRGSIPDMTSDSERYIALQNIYRTQAERDVTAVSRYVTQILDGVGQDVAEAEFRLQNSPSIVKPQDSITDSDVRLFCKNAAFLRLVRGRSLAEEYNPKTAQISEIATHLPAEEDSDDDGVHYVLLRAVQRFQSEFRRTPGADDVEQDILKLKNCVTKLLLEWGLTNQIKDDLIHEYCRYGGAELHTVASYMGGAAAQEVIKLITHQFVPINNTFIYNGTRQSSVTLHL